MIAKGDALDGMGRGNSNDRLGFYRGKKILLQGIQDLKAPGFAGRNFG